MAMLTTATTWEITGTQFLWCYGGVCAVAGGTILLHWQRILGPTEPAADEMPELGLYELAALGDGPQLAITSAASQLHRDGLIRAGDGDGLETVGELDDDADPIERAVFETVRAEPGICAYEMRERVEKSEALRSMIAELTDDGLLIERDAATALARRILLFGGLLTLLGLGRIAAGAIGGQHVGGLVLMVAVVVIGSIWLTGRTPVATHRGRAKLQRWRDAHDDLRRNPVGGECALAAALFGASVLWLASPDIASALGVEREATSSGGGGGGGCGSGCGGCGGCGG
jgi:uncharacterized protein (TIGR04222 family)